MTAQVEDTFQYRDVSYAITGISEGELFDIEALVGVTPRGVVSSCWRGYQATFGNMDSRLVLAALAVYLDDPTGGPSINGISPSSSQNGEFDNRYESLDYPIDYTGGVLLGDGFLMEFYMHMGFQDAWKYERAIELKFDRGVLTEEHDRTEDMAQTRKQALESGAYPGPFGTEKDGMLGFINSSFDRGYELE